MAEMVSVILPTFNREKTILRAIESVLNQTYTFLELIIVDDGSTDDTEQVVASVTDERIRYIRLPEHTSPAHARNVGIGEARYDYIAFQEATDEWLPEKLELQMAKLLSAPPAVGLVYCRMKTGEGMKKTIIPTNFVAADRLEGKIFRPLLVSNVVFPQMILMRRACLESVGLFHEKCAKCEDWEFILRAAKDWDFAFVDQILLYYNRDAGQPPAESTVEGLITRCYLVSLYHEEMEQSGFLPQIQDEILALADTYPGQIPDIIEELMRRAMKGEMEL